MTHALHPLATWVVHGRWPHILCGSCRSGHLTPDPESIRTPMSRQAKAAQRSPAWDVHFAEGVFNALATCSWSECAEEYVFYGRWTLEYLSQGDMDADRPTFLYNLKGTLPGLALVAAPDTTPPRIVECTAAAALLVWSSPGAAANTLRSAVEALMTAQGIRQYEGRSASRDSRLSLNRRLRLFQAKNPDVAALLDAVRWLGNAGSHDDRLDINDVLEGAEILQHALEKLYDKKPATLARRAKAIADKKGPVRARR